MINDVSYFASKELYLTDKLDDRISRNHLLSHFLNSLTKIIYCNTVLVKSYFKTFSDELCNKQK